MTEGAWGNGHRVAVGKSEVFQWGDVDRMVVFQMVVCEWVVAHKLVDSYTEGAHKLGACGTVVAFQMVEARKPAASQLAVCE